MIIISHSFNSVASLLSNPAPCNKTTHSYIQYQKQKSSVFLWDNKKRRKKEKIKSLCKVFQCSKINITNHFLLIGIKMAKSTFHWNLNGFKRVDHKETNCNNLCFSLSVNGIWWQDGQRFDLSELHMIINNGHNFILGLSTISVFICRSHNALRFVNTLTTG